MGKTYLVVDRMQTLIENWETAGDRRAVFLSCYKMMTTNMLAAVERGDFEDCNWVSSLLHHFADYYFKALEPYEQGHENIPAPWQIAFQATRRPRTHVMQNLVLGVNAHINYDLVFAVADMLEPEWSGLSPVARQSRYRDHCHVNRIIYQTINAVQDGIIERYAASMDLVDTVFGPLDEWLIFRLISIWREEVWLDATRYVEFSDEDGRSVLRHEVERRSLQRAHAILGKRGVAGLLDML
jgi:hypothetical protein